MTLRSLSGRETVAPLTAEWVSGADMALPGPLLLYGLLLTSDAPAVASLALVRRSGPTGELVVRYRLTALQSAQLAWHTAPIVAESGLYFTDAPAGNVGGIVYYSPMQRTSRNLRPTVPDDIVEW